MAFGMSKQSAPVPKRDHFLALTTVVLNLHAFPFRVIGETGFEEKLIATTKALVCFDWGHFQNGGRLGWFISIVFLL